MGIGARVVRALLLQHVSGVSVLLLCALVFWLGAKRAALPGVQPTAISSIGHRHASLHRVLKEHVDQSLEHTTSKLAGLSSPSEPLALTTLPSRAPDLGATQQHTGSEGRDAFDPLNSEQLEQEVLNASGISKVQSQVLPGASGEAHVRAVPFQILSWYPRIVLYPAFVDKRRCEQVISMAKQWMYPSGLAWRPDEQARADQQTRTSTGTFLSAAMDKEGVLAWIEQRIAAVTRLPRGLGEPFNVLHYQNAQHYDSHMDSFDPQLYGKQVSQRVATVLVYLSDVVEGGETIFKKEGINGHATQIRDYYSCPDNVLKYKPRMGDALLFYSVQPDQSIDPRALHGGCPVSQGEKWVATKWIHDRDPFSS